MGSSDKNFVGWIFQKLNKRLNAERLVSVSRLLIASTALMAVASVQAGAPSDLFVFTVDVTDADQTPAGQFEVPTTDDNFQLTWEQVGNELAVNSGGLVHITAPNTVLNFGGPGIYRVSIDPIDVPTGEQWGTTPWITMTDMFRNASIFTGFTATDVPDLSNMSDMSDLFSGASAMVNVNNIGAWDMSNITTFYAMFAETPICRECFIGQAMQIRM